MQGATKSLCSLTVNGDKIFGFTQDDDPIYGTQVSAFEITQLTKTNYAEQEVAGNPILKESGTGWNGNGMHHIDPHQLGDNRWIASVDGWTEVWEFGFE